MGVGRWAVIGLGNPMREDDGVGPRVIEELIRRGLPEGVTALDAGTGGLDLFHLLEGWTGVVVVDAADVGQRPGEFVRFMPEQVESWGASDGLSLHHAGLPEVIALSKALGRNLPPLIVIGVQPARIGWGEGLSEPVELAVPALVETILREVGD